MLFLALFRSSFLCWVLFSYCEAALRADGRVARPHTSKSHTSLAFVVQGFQAQESCRWAQLFFDAQQLVVLGDAVGAGGGAGFDLAGAGGDGEVGDEGVFGFAGAVGDDGGVAVAAGQVDGFEGFADRADLVDFDQDGVGDSLLDALPRISMLVTKMSSPTSWIFPPSSSVRFFQPSQSSSARPSSRETMGYSFRPSSPRSRPSRRRSWRICRIS